MRFETLAILLYVSGCIAPFAIAGILKAIDHLIERRLKK